MNDDDTAITGSDSNWVRHVWVPGCTSCETCSDDGSDNVSITFEIPGVKKENISLRVIPDGLRLEATRDEHTKYVSEYAFLCPADTGHVKASYQEGILEVSVPLECKDPFDAAGPVSIE